MVMTTESMEKLGEKMRLLLSSVIGFKVNNHSLISKL